MWCAGTIEGGAAEACLCPCGILACERHGHADVGDDPYGPHGLRAESMAEIDGRGYEDIDLSRGEEGRA
jgi:hypothetical protein